MQFSEIVKRNICTHKARSIEFLLKTCYFLREKNRSLKIVLALFFFFLSRVIAQLSNAFAKYVHTWLSLQRDTREKLAGHISIVLENQFEFFPILVPNREKWLERKRNFRERGRSRAICLEAYIWDVLVYMVSTVFLMKIEVGFLLMKIQSVSNSV